MSNSKISSSDVKIAWIGTGIMGAPMAMHLVDAGYNVSVYSRTKSKAEKLIAKGCEWYDNPAALTGNCNIIFTIVGYPEDVEEVYFGRNGIMKSLKKDSVVIDMTTTLPGLAIRIDEACQKIGAHFIDAPVSGGEVGAINGALSVMIGGEKDVVEQVLPVIDVFSKNMVYQGKAGAGQHTKMCNQIVVAGAMIGVCESLIYGYKAGLDLNTVLSSIGKGAAACWTLDMLAPKVIHRGVVDVTVGQGNHDVWSSAFRGPETECPRIEIFHYPVRSMSQSPSVPTTWSPNAASPSRAASRVLRSSSPSICLQPRLWTMSSWSKASNLWALQRRRRILRTRP